MKNIWIAVAVLGLLAAPGLAVINVKVTADATALAAGQETIIRLLAQGTDSGLAALGGSIVASNPSALQAVPGTFEWSSAFSSISGLPPTLGSAADGGGWGGFGSMQPIFPPSTSFARSAFVEVARYRVQAAAGLPGVVTLSFQPGKFGGFLPAETSASQTLGTLTSVTITPEPLSLALLALGGLAVLRRRA